MHHRTELMDESLQNQIKRPQVAMGETLIAIPGAMWALQWEIPATREERAMLVRMVVQE
jgi:hypothetical protein